MQQGKQRVGLLDDSPLAGAQSAGGNLHEGTLTLFLLCSILSHLTHVHGSKKFIAQ